jgi:hypothetical protein
LAAGLQITAYRFAPLAFPKEKNLTAAGGSCQDFFFHRRVIASAFAVLQHDDEEIN